MSPVDMLTYGGFVALVMNKSALLGVGWLLACFLGVIPDNELPQAFLVLMGVMLFTKIRR